MRRVAWLAMALAVSGCASQNFSLRTVPPATPADDIAAAISSQAAAAKAADASRASGAGAAALTPAEAPSMATYDPWQRANRFIYRFNTRFDEWLFLPVANGYRRMPGAVRASVHNFFGNLAEPKTVVNDVLQLHPVAGVRSLGRFVVNSTLGIVGLFDVATKLHLVSAPTGLSATLSTWGVHPGPYLVIPILGPSTLRDGFGLLGDFGVSYAINLANLYRGDQAWGLSVVDGIDQRANTDFRYYASGSPFEYDTIRFLYVHRDLIEDDARRAARQDAKRPPQQ